MTALEKLEIKREVLLRLIKALLDGEELEEIAKIISTDPNLSAKLLSFINSPYFGLKREIKSITQAIAYLGYRNLKDYAFILLTTSFLADLDKEEIKKHLKFAYLMNGLARKLMPLHEDEAFMVGILEPVKRQIGREELEALLKRAGISKLVIDGLLEPSSPLGKLKIEAQMLMALCDKLSQGEIANLPKELEKLEAKELLEICILADDKAQSILSTL